MYTLQTHFHSLSNITEVIIKIITFLLISGRFPTNGQGAGPGIPNFLKVEKGATAYLESHAIINNMKNLFVLHAMKLLQQHKTKWSTLKSGDSVKGKVR